MGSSFNSEIFTMFQQTGRVLGLRRLPGKHALRWAQQCNRNEASVVLAAARGDATRAAQLFAWAQNPEFKGKEVLFASMVGVNRLQSPVDAQRLASSYAAHRDVTDALPPRSTPPIAETEMRPVPNLANINSLAKTTDITPAYLAQMEQKGYTYVNTATIVNVRHGETTGNVVSGGYFAGGLVGPWGPQLTEKARIDASNLYSEMQKIAPQVGAIIVSPTDRALDTYRRATQDVDFPHVDVVKVEMGFAEHHIGGFLGLKKPRKGGVTKMSGIHGIKVGITEDGNLGVDKNTAVGGKDYVPPMEPQLTSVPRVIPVRSEGRAESWNQMETRIRNVMQRDVLPELAEGKNILIFDHQYVASNMVRSIYGGSIIGGYDPVAMGHNVPNTGPMYMPVHVFKDANGKLLMVPATVGGQSQLGAPGQVPKGQTPPP
jgi:broad specificity phosphatase PhoE